jgi:hypothetical protein
MTRTANHALLARYFNTGQLGRFDLVVGGFSPAFLFRKNAPEVIRMFHSGKHINGHGKSHEFHIPLYSGNDQVVLKIADFLKKELSDDLEGAYLHGSLATGERIGYSDFDGLLILKDAVFDNPERASRVAEKISRSFSMMIAFDPLQHHGWFIVTNKDLTHFPETYFPMVLFERAASLLPDGTTLNIIPAKTGDTYSGQLQRLAGSVIRKIDNGKGLKNMFTLKGLLSEFMLLPSLYLESKTGQGVFKKESFELARQHFNEGDWKVMDEVSQIRKDWKYTPTWSYGQQPSPVTPYIKKIQASKAGPLPPDLRSRLDASFTARMRNLASLFIEKGL